MKTFYKKSPFTPYLGTIPKVFVGRNREIELFKTCLDDAAKGKPSSILLTGIRGSGKTVLLKYFSVIAKETAFHSVYIPLDESCDTPSTISQRIYGKVKATLETEFLSLRAKKLMKRLEPSAFVKIKDLELRLSVSLNQEQINESNFASALGTLIKNKKITIFLDETQSSLADGTPWFLVNTLYAELPETASHWVFVLAGTPFLLPKIAQATPADRAFVQITLTNLKEKEVTKILQGTVKGTAVSFASAVCRFIAQDTQGIAFYIQFFGDQLFQFKEEGEITSPFYLKKKQEILAALGENIYKTRIQELERKGLYFDILVKIALLDNGQGIALKEITPFFKSYLGPYLIELESKGYLVKLSRGCYQIQDKLFREWIQSHYT